MGDWWNPFDDDEGVHKATPKPNAGAAQLQLDPNTSASAALGQRYQWQAEANRGRAAGAGGAASVGTQNQAPAVGAAQSQAAQSVAAQANYAPATGSLMRGGQQMQSSDLAGLGQFQLAGQLASRANGTAGPSLAEMSMQRQSEAAQRQNLAAAAGGGGPGNVAAQINANNQNALAQNQLTQDVGIQRAAEQQQAQAQLADVLGTARQQGQSGAGVYGNYAGMQADMAANQAAMQQQTALSNAGFAQQSAMQNADLSQQANLANMGAVQDYAHLNQAAAMANQQRDIQLSQQNLIGRGQNDAMEQFYAGLENQSFENQAARNMQQDTNRGNWAIGQAANQINSQNGERQMFGGMLQGGSAAAALLLSDVRAKKDIEPGGKRVDAAFRNFGGVTRGTSGPVAGGYGNMDTYMGDDPYGDPYAAMDGRAVSTAQDPNRRAALASMMSRGFGTMSDIRAKTAVAPGGEYVDDTYRALGDYGYDYIDPKYGQGRHYGPMAQEFEKTPAGASVVAQAPNGMKGIDTDRLSVMNASETGRLRREMDDLRAMIRAPAARGSAAPINADIRYGSRDMRNLGALTSADVDYIDRSQALRAPASSVAPTDLVYDQRSDSFRSPAEQFDAQYAAGNRNVRHVVEPTSLVFNEKDDTFRTPEAQLAYSRRAEDDARAKALAERNARDRQFLATYGAGY